MPSKTLLAFDIDGTLLSGPPALLNIAKYIFTKTKNISKIDSKPTPKIARLLDNSDDYLAFLLYFIQKPNPNAKKTLEILSQKPNLELCILTGRGQKLLKDLTYKLLSKHDLLHYFDNIYLKPKIYKSSTSFKLDFLRDRSNQYKELIIIENDLLTGLKIADFAKKKHLPIKVVILKSLETHSLILKLLKLNKLKQSNVYLINKLNTLATLI